MRVNMYIRSYLCGAGIPRHKIETFASAGDWRIFHPRACSLPPFPTIKTFMIISAIIYDFPRRRTKPSRISARRACPHTVLSSSCKWTRYAKVRGFEMSVRRIFPRAFAEGPLKLCLIVAYSEGFVHLGLALFRQGVRHSQRAHSTIRAN